MKRLTNKDLKEGEIYRHANGTILKYGDVQEFLKIKDCNKVLELIQQKLNL